MQVDQRQRGGHKRDQAHQRHVSMRQSGVLYRPALWRIGRDRSRASPRTPSPWSPSRAAAERMHPTPWASPSPPAPRPITAAGAPGCLPGNRLHAPGRGRALARQLGVVRQHRGKLVRQVHTCACGGAGCAFSVPAGPRRSPRHRPRLSIAVTDATQRLYVFDNASGSRIEACYACANAGRLGRVQLSGRAPRSPPMASSWPPSTTAAGCSGRSARQQLGGAGGTRSAWTASPSGSRWRRCRTGRRHHEVRPVLAGSRPALLYLAEDGALHLLIP